LRRLGCIDLFFAIPFWKNFSGLLIVADGFRDMLINFVLQSSFNQPYVPQNVHTTTLPLSELTYDNFRKILKVFCNRKFEHSHLQKLLHFVRNGQTSLTADVFYGHLGPLRGGTEGTSYSGLGGPGDR